MLKLCGEAEDKLAQELIHFELQVERDVIEPLFVLAEVRVNLCPGSFRAWFGIDVNGSLADLRTVSICLGLISSARYFTEELSRVCFQFIYGDTVWFNCSQVYPADNINKYW